MFGAIGDITSLVEHGDGSACELYPHDTEIYAATLERHLDAFGNCNLDEIMADYDDNAVLQVRVFDCVVLATWRHNAVK